MPVRLRNVSWRNLEINKADPRAHPEGWEAGGNSWQKRPVCCGRSWSLSTAQEKEQVCLTALPVSYPVTAIRNDVAVCGGKALHRGLGSAPSESWPSLAWGWGHGPEEGSGSGVRGQGPGEGWKLRRDTESLGALRTKRSSHLPNDFSVFSA